MKIDMILKSNAIFTGCGDDVISGAVLIEGNKIAGVVSAEEAQQYLASLAGILNEKSLWTRTPIDGEDWGIYRAVLRQQEDGTNEVVLINTAWSLVNEVFPVMWVDINQLLQNWASAE